MFIRKIIVQVENNGTFPKDNYIKVSKVLCKKWEIEDGKQVTLQLGLHQEKVIIIEAPSIKTAKIEMTAVLKEKLAIPFEIFPIHCLYKQNENKLTLGPTITCITNQMYHEDTKFGSMTPFFEEMARFSKNHHILFYVLPLIKREKSFVGYILDQMNWVKKDVPTPNAVYNRIGSRSFETSIIFKDFSEFLHHNRISYFNQRFLDKWEIDQALSSFPEMVPYLPDTIIFDDYERFAEKLTIHDFLFIKPVSGSQGRQILRIENKDQQYIVYYSTFSQKVSTTFRSSYILYKRLKERLKQQRFIIQQGIELIHVDDRPLDFRILCVKNQQNQWKVISSVARISPKERIVSNLAQGGEQKRPFDVLVDLYDETLAKQYVKLMNELAIEVANLISESYEGLYGELGIDIALDKQGKLWIIEVNSKPSKSEQDQPTEKIRPSTKAIVDYLAHLAGFNPEKGEIN